ncbi:MAG: hypothetical protein WBG48_08650 [Pricia sp.]
MDNKKKESKPADMHSDGVHFDKDILESKRNESARATTVEKDNSETLKADVSKSEGKDDGDETSNGAQNTSKKTK